MADISEALEKYRATRQFHRAAQDVLTANQAADAAGRKAANVTGRDPIDIAVSPAFRVFYEGGSTLTNAVYNAFIATMVARVQVLDLAGTDVVALGKALEGIAAIDAEFAE
jgi:hypothetical protein